MAMMSTERWTVDILIMYYIIRVNSSNELIHHTPSLLMIQFKMIIPYLNGQYTDISENSLIDNYLAPGGGCEVLFA